MSGRCPQCNSRTIRQSSSPCALCRPYNWAMDLFQTNQLTNKIAQSGNLVVYEAYYEPHEDWQVICVDVLNGFIVAVRISGRSLTPAERKEFGVR